jgi:hypothetical protein
MRSRILSGAALVLACVVAMPTVALGQGGPSKPPQPVAPPPVPNTTITSGPIGITTNDNTPVFTFTSDVPGATFTCTMDGGAGYACASGAPTAVLADGSHTLTVAAKDPASGVSDDVPAVATFTVDSRRASAVSIRSRHVHVGPTGAAGVKLACDAGIGNCEGALTLTKRLAVRTSANRLVMATIILGRARFTIAPGGSQVVHLTLSRTALIRMRRADSRALVIRATATSAANSPQNLVEFSLF